MPLIEVVGKAGIPKSVQYGPNVPKVGMVEASETVKAQIFDSFVQVRLVATQ